MSKKVAMRKKIVTTKRGPLDDSEITSNRFVQAAMLQYLASELILPGCSDEWADSTTPIFRDCFKRIGLSPDVLPQPLDDMVHQAIMEGSHAMYKTLIAAGLLRTSREEDDRFFEEEERREHLAA